jgi:hypothetical protein
MGDIDKLMPGLGGSSQGREGGGGCEVQDLEDNFWGKDRERIHRRSADSHLSLETPRVFKKISDDGGE